MLRHERQVQDENAGVSTERHLEGKRIHGTPLAKHASSDGRQRGLGSSRKALGDVSNNGSLLTQLKGQQTAGRRALGDITNATPQQRSQRPVQAKASGQAEIVAGVIHAAVGTRDAAEVYAEEGTESCAGRTWRQQELLRERQQDAEIAARVLAFTSAPFRIPRPPSHRQDNWSTGAQMDDQRAVPDESSQSGSPPHKLDLDVLQPALFLLQTPALDWTFGGTFPVSMPETEGDIQE